MRVLAVIFDLDGTVLDNEDEYANAFKSVLGDLGKEVKDEYPQVGGIGVKENWPLLLKKYKVKTKKTPEELTKDTQDAYLARVFQVEPKAGFEDFITDLKTSGITTALATSNDWHIVEKVFEELDLEKYFDVVTTGEEVLYKKPDPDLFLTTARKLEIDPEVCLVIEDAQSGVKAAHRAGMKVIGIARDEKHAQTLLGADLIIYSYTELTPSLLSQL